MNIKNIISQFGGQQVVANICGITQGAVSQWKEFIPSKHQPALIEEARRKGLDIDPLTIVGIPAQSTRESRSRSSNPKRRARQ